MKILVANVGSTSFKFKLFDMADGTVAAEGVVEGIGAAESPFRFRIGTAEQDGRGHFPSYDAAVRRSVEALLDPKSGVLASPSDLGAVGFKTVHGKDMVECRILDDEVLRAMEDYNFLAPAHNPPYIRAIRIFKQLVDAPLVGLFEPAFHRSVPEYAYTYGLPYELAREHGIRKYGFHGASHRYISERAPVVAGIPQDRVRLISCHLGGSSSVCAVLNGDSIDVSMGFSPQSGVLNAKRCGDLDPFIPLYLQKAAGLDADQVADLLNNRSGLLGISGVSADMKEIIKAADAGSKRAQLAIDTFCYGVRHYIGAFHVALGGCDLLVFTGGIGERSPRIRAGICKGLECIGVELDSRRNETAAGESIISAPDSIPKIAVVRTNEEWVVAREVQRKIDRSGIHIG